MVGSHDSTTWFRTEFVLVAELDECARAESLWIIQNPHCQTNLDNLDHQHHFDFMHWKFAAFENYGVFGFDQINNDMPKASRLSCVGGEEWHRIGEMLERRDAQGLLLLSILTWATQWDPSHFVMLARRTQDGRFEHATVVLSNPPTSAAQIKRARYTGPYWTCSLPGHERRASCLGVPTGQGALWRLWQDWQLRELARLGS